MARNRSVNVFTTVSFVAIISSVAIVQAVLELRQGERPQALDVFRQTPTVENLRAYETSLQESIWVEKKLRPWMQYVQFLMLQDAGEKAVVGRGGWLFYKPGVEYLTSRLGTETTVGTSADPLPAILSFRDDLAARGIRLLVVPVPNKESIYPEMLTRRARRMGIAVCPQTRRLLKQLKASGVEVVDLFEAFQDAKRAQGQPSGQPLYLAQDSHWSPVGVELAAQVVARRILERRWIEPGNLKYDKNPVRLRRLGDVVEMLQSPQIERRVGPQELVCTQIVQRENGAVYEDEPDSDILVLGDSCLRIYERDEPGAAGFVSHLARELKQPLTSIVNDGGASTLVRQQLYGHPELLVNKKVVIWEFVERDIAFGTEGWQLVPLPPVSSVEE